MWRITWGDYRAGEYQPVYSPRLDEFRPVDMDFAMSVEGDAGSLQLTLAPDHPAYGELEVVPDAWIEVVNDEVGEGPLWRGFLTETGEPIAGSSYGEVEFTFAGELAQLSQATCPRFDREWTSTTAQTASRACAQFLLDAYNAHVARDLEEADEPSAAGSRQFALGRVDDFGPTINAADDGTSDVLEVLTALFVDRLGGYIRVVYGSAPTLEILSDLTDGNGNKLIAEQQVALGANLIDGERTVDATGLWTGVKPYGENLGKTEYAGKFYSSFERQGSRPSDWKDSYGDYYRLALFEPLTSEPAGWRLKPADALEAGYLPWHKYWYWAGNRFQRLETLARAQAHIQAGTCPEFLTEGSSGLPPFWSCATDVGGQTAQLDPYALTTAQLYEHMEPVGGFGYSRLDRKPNDWDTSAGSYVRPVVQGYRVPSVNNGPTTEAATYTHWLAAEDTYTALAKRPKHWYWENGKGNYSSYYRKVADAVDVTTGQAVNAYVQVEKVFTRVSAKPKKWADKYTSYFWADSTADRGYSAIGSWQQVADTTSTPKTWWRLHWTECRKRTFNSRTGVESFSTEFKERWVRMDAHGMVYNPYSGTYVTLDKARWREVRGCIYFDTKGKGDKAHGKTSKANAGWGKKWKVVGNKIEIGGKKHDVWCKLPKDSWDAVKSNCWARKAPKFKLHAVYKEEIPTFAANRYYQRKAPAWQAGRYWVQRAVDTALWTGEDSISGEKVWPATGSWAAEPIYSATGLDDLPLTLDLAPASKLDWWLKWAAGQAELGDELDVEGDVLWDVDAAERYGRRVKQLDVADARDFQTLLEASCRALKSQCQPAVEVELSAIDLSYRDGGEPLLAGRYVAYTDPARGYAGHLLPLTEVSGLDFSDPSRGRVKLGGTGGPTARAKVERSLDYAGILFSDSITGDLNRGWNDAAGS